MWLFGDEVFTLMENLMKPYLARNLTREEIISNIIGNLVHEGNRERFWNYGIGVFWTEINMSVKNIDAVVLAYCVLQNYSICNAGNSYLSPSSIDF